MSRVYGKTGVPVPSHLPVSGNRFLLLYQSLEYDFLWLCDNINARCCPACINVAEYAHIGWNSTGLCRDKSSFGKTGRSGDDPQWEHLWQEKGLSGHQFYLGISGSVNANASPDWPKPLYQWGGCASPLIQSFGCSMHTVVVRLSLFQMTQIKEEETK